MRDVRSPVTAAAHLIWDGGLGPQAVAVWYFIAMATLIEPASTSAATRQATEVSDAMPPREHQPDPWGVTYAGCADPETAAEAIEKRSQQLGMSCTRQPLATGALRLRAVHTGPWYLVLAGARPQKVDWQLHSDRGQLRLTSDLRIFRWYAVLLAALVVLIAAGLTISTLIFEAADAAARHEIAHAVAVVFLGAVVLSPAVAFLLGALGGGRQIAALWQPILDRVEQDGGRLEPQGRTVSRRYGLAMLGFLVLFLGLAGWPVGKGLYDFLSSSGIRFGIGTALLGIVVTAFLAAVLIYRRRTFMLRADLVLGGLVSAVSMVAYLALPLPLLASGADAGELGGFDRDGAAVVAGAGEATLREGADDLVVRRAALRRWCWLMIGFTALVALVAAVLGLSGIYLSIPAWRTVWRLQKQRGWELVRKTMGEAPPLRRIRWVFVPTWMLCAAVILSGLGFAVLSAGQAIAPILSAPAFRLPELSAGVLAFALGRPFDDPVVAFVVGRAWVLYGAVALALWLISTGQLLIARRAARRRLRAAARIRSHRRQEEVEELLDGLCVKAKDLRVHLVVTESALPEASAITFGLGRQERFITISAGCLDRLANEEIQALLAHELSHHLRRHCRLDQLLRWLGRLTFAGDGFVLALQHSWGYELGADRGAADALGVPESVLLRTLRRVRQVQALSELASKGDRPAGLAALPREPEAFVAWLDGDGSPQPLGERFRLAWQLFREQYFDAIGLYYWHPPYADRKEALRT